MIRLPYICAGLIAAASSFVVSTPAIAVEKTGKSKWTATKMFEKKDNDKDGFLTLKEFRLGGSKQFLEKAKERFEVLDIDEDGKISLDELKSGWASMTRNKKK